MTTQSAVVCKLSQSHTIKINNIIILYTILHDYSKFQEWNTKIERIIISTYAPDLPWIWFPLTIAPTHC